MRYTIALLAALLLAGCASPDIRVTAKDLAAATRLAERGQDRLALQCYAYWKPRIGTDEPIEIVGPLSAYQLARNVRRLVEGASEEATLACGPLRADSTGAVLRLVPGL